MYRHHRHRYGPGFGHPWRPFGGAIWLIGLGILFLWGHWWPGILVLIGLNMVLEALFMASAPTRPQESPPPPPVFVPLPAAPRPVPAPAQPIHRIDLLPATCQRCGAPIRLSEVKWTGAQSAACPYCGSNLLMKQK